jgi:RHS repeat-associated protein
MSAVRSATPAYLTYGDCRNSTGTIDTDILFTGQRLDGTGLYYYGARYYDPTIGRFISADTIVPNPANPQSLNRYSYCLNNPLKYIDPTGHQEGEGLGEGYTEGALGWTTDGWFMWCGGAWHSIDSYTADYLCAAFGASSMNSWSDFVAPIASYYADFLESGLPSTMWPEMFAQFGDQKYMLHPQQIFNPETRANVYQLTLVPIPDMTWSKHDWINTCNRISLAGDLVFWVPVVGEIGYLVSGAAGTASFILTTQEYRDNNATRQDMWVSLITAGTGWIPGNFYSSLAQAWWDQYGPGSQ